MPVVAVHWSGLRLGTLTPRDPVKTARSAALSEPSATFDPDTASGESLAPLTLPSAIWPLVTEPAASFGVVTDPSASFGVLTEPAASFGVVTDPSASFVVVTEPAEILVLVTEPSGRDCNAVPA